MIGKLETINAHHRARVAVDALLVAYWANDVSVHYHIDRAIAALTEAAATLGYDLVAQAAPEEGAL